ncbi:Transposase [Cupriavidus necator]
MANIGPNRGRRLRIALSRFAAMLIEEARDFTGLTFEQLDEALELKEGEAIRYSRYPIERGTRAPNADDIQDLEDRVARLLKRPAHTVVVENNAVLNADPYADPVIGEPRSGMNLRDLDATDVQLGYEGDWPTYRRLKYSPPTRGVRVLDLYLWQWGILWDKGVLPWSREALGLPQSTPVEEFLPALVQEVKRQRQEVFADLQHLQHAGILPESLSNSW